MFVEHYPAKNLWTEFSLLPSSSESVLFWSQTENGWGRAMAWDPVARIDLNLSDDFTSVQAFVKQNAERFIVGYISYEAGMIRLNVIPQKEKNDNLPAISFRAYDRFRVFDYEDTVLPSTKILPPKFNLSIQKARYQKQIERIKHHIRLGDVYQLNYTHQMSADTLASPRELFPYFIQQNQVEFAAYLEWNGVAVHSLSPERFIKIENRMIQTEPVKGTRPRGKTAQEVNENVKKLLGSRKETSELNMIIDLMRNDLGKVCITGSVNVVESRSIKTLKEVMHTYGVVQGQLKPELGVIDTVLSLSPGGSISGCPKKRAVEIIDNIEDQNRGIYTGSIGYILPDGKADFNIAIRTVIQEGNRLTLGVGGGITIESEGDDEFKESLAKAQSFQP